MTPREVLEKLCNRYGLSTAYGQSLLPLVERALNAPPGVRKRLLELIEGHLQREAKRRAERDKGQGDEELLCIVSRILHPWSPPEWLTRWTKDDPSPRRKRRDPDVGESGPGAREAG